VTGHDTSQTVNVTVHDTLQSMWQVIKL
jgi:hypothetical protein